MKIIKRNGAEAVFDIDKIVMAVTKANEATDEKVRMTPLQIQRISESVQISCEEMGRSPSVEEIQDLVEKAIMSLIECNNEEVKQENANKNPHHQRRPAGLYGGRGE